MKTIEDLKEMNTWLLWRKRNRDNKVAKMPIDTNGKACGTNEIYADRWVTYADAVAAVADANADGVGFRIPSGMFFLDIDHRSDDDPMVVELLEKFDTYAERSVSGEGIHIYGLCDIASLPCFSQGKDGKWKLSKDYYMHHPDNGLELYVGECTNRFAVFTGDVLMNQPLKDCTHAVHDTMEQYMRKQKELTEEEKREQRVEKIVQALREQHNGQKFSLLFDKGEMDGNPSWSDKDATLCAMLAFRTGDDMELLDAAFRRSALYRDKWEREDYRESTMEKAIAACEKWRQKQQVQKNPEPKREKSKKSVKKKRPPFVKVDDKKRETVSAPLLAKYVREHMDYIQVRDKGNQAVLRYVYENGVYVLHDTNMFYGRIKQYIADYDEELVKMSVVKEAAQQVLSDLEYVPQTALNADESIINFQNGLLRISADKVELLPHSPKVYSTIQIPCVWKDQESPTPVFDSYLRTLADDQEDVVQLLLEFMGACLSNISGWRMKKALFLVGDGNTGKSQLKSLTERLLGKGNYIGIDLSEIEARFGTGAIYGTRLAGSSDMSFLSVDELKTFKKVTGGDSLFAEFKGQQPFEYVYSGLLWFCMNRLPRFSGDLGQWVYNRIMVISCPNVITTEKQDRQLLDKMYAEKEGIVHKCITALQRVIANGYRFTEPESVCMAREEYQMINSTVLTFAEECLCPWPNGKVSDPSCTTGTIHKVYVAWCKDNNNGYAKSAKEFREELASYNKTAYQDMVTRRNGNTFYKEYTLTEDTKKDYGYILR